eukprot:1593952-Amphidinium_carterae.2
MAMPAKLAKKDLCQTCTGFGIKKEPSERERPSGSGFPYIWTKSQVQVDLETILLVIPVILMHGRGERRAPKESLCHERCCFED